MLFTYVVATEALLSKRGFATAVDDTEVRWLRERARASSLGVQGLILVGASRIQLDFDLNVLRRETGLEPVQLAIDGSSYVPVLLGLAQDSTVRGTVILDLMPGPVSIKAMQTGRSGDYQARYDAARTKKTRSWPTYRTLNSWLSEAVRSRLVNFADGGRPWDSLVNRLLNSKATPQYLTTFSDRSRQADYQKVKMPDFYLSRVHRHLGSPPEVSVNQPADQLALELVEYVKRIKPATESAPSPDELADLESAVSAIQSRGGRVLIAAMPTSGLVLEADSRRFPRALYWDRVVAATSAHTIDWQDHTALSSFVCPDGSHLDKRDIAAFTRAFVSAAGLGRP